MKTLAMALLLVLVSGCGSGNDTAETDDPYTRPSTVSARRGGAVSSDLADAAHTLAQQGKVAELRAMLVENPNVANATLFRTDNILNVVIDTRPEFPNMHQTLELLLEAGGDPNRNAPELLRKAIWRGDPESLELLLEHGADPTIVSSKRKMNMLDYARSTGDERFEPILRAWEAKHRR